MGFRPTTLEDAGNTKDDPCVINSVPAPCPIFNKIHYSNNRIMAPMGKIDGM
jgi:hypothetical protein